MTEREERLEEIKIYREAARHYFSTRSNLTYINIIGCGTVAVLFARSLVEAPNNCYVSIVQNHYWLYFAGLLIIFALAAWVTAICNLLSNSFYSYMIMVRELEDDLRIQYPPPKSWAVTFEFLTRDAQNDVQGAALRGNVWNIANTFLALCGIYAMIVVSQIAQVGAIFYLAWLAYISLVAIVVILSMKKKAVMAIVGVLILGFSALPLVATPTQREKLFLLSPFSVSVFLDPNFKSCDGAKVDVPLAKEASPTRTPKSDH